jgi:PAS domain S-box-containing protein
MTGEPRVVYVDPDEAMRRAVRAVFEAAGLAAVAVPDAARRHLDPAPDCVVVVDPDDAAAVEDAPVVVFADDAEGPDAVDRRGADALVRLRAAVREAVGPPGRALTADEYRTIANAVQDPVYVLDDEGRFRRVNDAFVDLVGHPREEIVGSHVSLVKSDEAVATGERELRRLFGPDAPESVRFEVDVTAADGGVRRCEDHVALLPAPGGGFVGSAGVLRDVTDRHERERRLRRERDRVRLLFDRSPVPIVRFRLDDGAPVVAETNPAFDRTFGTDGVAPGTPVDDLHVPDDEHESATRINERIRAGETVEAEVTRETPDGRREFLLHVATSGDDGAVEEGYAIYVDVTEQAAYEAALERQTRWLEGFAEVFSHDLTSPLNAAQGNLDLALEAADDTDEVAERLAAADRALDRATELVRELSDALRAGTVDVDPQPTALSALARDAWAALDAGGATLDAADAPRVRADRLAAKRLLENLFRNAVVHADDPTVRVRTIPGGFAVDDDGPGIPEDERESVFAPGYTTSADGSGFGLLSVRQVALAHDWTVTATESPEGGARIAVTGVETV